MSFPESDPAAEWEFVELWVDSTAFPPYVLMLMREVSGSFKIIDPAKEYAVAFTGNSYETAKLWLLEDEYERVEGRLNQGLPPR